MNPPSSSFLLRLILPLVTLFFQSYADVYNVPSQEVFYGTPRLQRVVAMYSAKDSPTRGPPGNGASYIKLNLNVRTADGSKISKGVVQVVILEDDSIDNIGIELDGGMHYCCNEDTSSNGVSYCDASEMNSVMLYKNTPEKAKPHKVYDVNFLNSNSASLTAYYKVERTGEHILFTSSCDPVFGSLNVTISGKSEWMNPYGYLPGHIYGFMPFYEVMSFVYLGLGVVWFVLNSYFWREVIHAHNLITVVLMMTLLEMGIRYYDYRSFNSSGTRSMEIMVTGILVASLHRTLSRVLVVAVGSGWGVSRPILGRTFACKLVLLGFTYFVCESALELVIRYGQVYTEVSKQWRLWLAVPVSALNAVWYWWIFVTLFDVTKELTDSKETEKLTLYRRFTGVLSVSLVLALSFAAYQVYYLGTGLMSAQWDIFWLVDGGFEQIVYLIIFVAISFLWKPSTNTRRIAYSQLGSTVGVGEAEFALEMEEADNSKFTLGDEEEEEEEDEEEEDNDGEEDSDDDEDNETVVIRSSKDEENPFD